MLYGIVLRDFPKQVVSLAKAKSVLMKQRKYRIDVTASTVERKTCGPASAGACPRECKDFLTKIRTRTSLGARSVVPFRGKNVIRHDKTRLHVLIDTWTTGEATHTRARHTVSTGIYIDSVLLEIHSALETTRSASSNLNEELADRVSRDTITKQQIDLATRLMLEQVSRLSDGDYDQSVAIQLFLDCIDRVKPRHQLLLFRSERNPHISTIPKN